MPQKFLLRAVVCKMCPRTAYVWIRWMCILPAGVMCSSRSFGPQLCVQRPDLAVCAGFTSGKEFSRRTSAGPIWTSRTVKSSCFAAANAFSLGWLDCVRPRCRGFAVVNPVHPMAVVAYNA